MVKEIIVKDLDSLTLAAKEFVDAVGERRVVSFKGSMGAGKTTFIKAICDVLEVEDNVCSPTFAICNVYYSKKAGEIYHFDFYRLENEEQALDIGVEENFYSGNYCFMEWAENIPSLIPSDCVEVKIKEIEKHQRKITLIL